MTEPNPYKELYLAMREFERHIRANGINIGLPEFQEIWANVVERFNECEAYSLLEDGAARAGSVSGKPERDAVRTAVSRLGRHGTGLQAEMLCGMV